MTCGTLIEFCQEDFPIPPRLPPPPPILSYYFEDNKLNSSFYCEFCSNLEASLDPLQTRYGSGEGLFSNPTQNITVILFIVAALSAAIGSAVTLVWRRWFRCKDGGILSKAFGASHSSHSADISTTPDGRRRSSRTASLRSSSALHNLQKRLSSSSFISRRSLYQPHPGTMISSQHARSGGHTMSNNTYCECPSSMVMMMCSNGIGGTALEGGNNLNASTTSTATTTSLSPCLVATMNPSAPTASTLSISSNGGNVYAELDPVSIQQQVPPPPPYPICATSPSTHFASQSNGLLPISSLPMTILGNLAPVTSANQYVVNHHRRRQPAPLPPIPTVSISGNEPQLYQHNSSLTSTNNALNISSSHCIVNSNFNITSFPAPVNQTPSGNTIELNQMEMNDLNDTYYSDLNCKQIQF